MIVVDASAALSALLNDGPARQALSTDQVHAPHLIDSEVAGGVRRAAMAGRFSADSGWVAPDAWRRLATTRYAVHTLLDRIWQLREDVSASDAGYVALAEALGCPLVTADARLSRAPVSGARSP